MTTHVTIDLMKDLDALKSNNTDASISMLFDDLNPVNLGYKYHAIGHLLRTFENNSSVTKKFNSLVTDFEQRIIDFVIYDLPVFETIDFSKSFIDYDALSIEILIYSQTQGKGVKANGW